MLLQKSQQIWGLIDCDSFFASCEIFRNPDLEGQKVLVARDTDIVLAASYAAKAYGIKTGTPMREARKMAPDLIVVPPDFALYEQCSRALIEFLKARFEEVEVFSIDECFVNLTGFVDRDDISLGAFVCGLKEEIKQKVGIPVSIGAAPTRLLAKIFASLQKPFGEFVAMQSDDIEAILQFLPLKHIPFVGKKWVEHLRGLCSSAHDFQQLHYETVRSKMGRSGLKLRLELHSINALTLGHKSTVKGISRARSFHPNFTNDVDKLWHYLLVNIEKAYAQLIDKKMLCKHVRVMFRDKGFAWTHLDSHLPFACDDRQQIMDLARQLFLQLHKPGILYRTTGISLGELEKKAHQQLSIFDLESKQLSSDKLQHVMRQINKKYGSGILRTATLTEKPGYGFEGAFGPVPDMDS